MPIPTPHAAIAASRPSFRAVSPWRIPAPALSPTTFAPAASRIAPIAVSFIPRADIGTSDAAYVARPVAIAAVMPGSVTSSDIQPYWNATRGPNARRR